MKAATVIWTILVLVLGGYIVYKFAAGPGMGLAYVEAEPVVGDDDDPVILPDGEPMVRFVDATYLEYLADQADDDDQTVYFSLWRTVGLWVAAFFTLAIFSFLYKDNPFYKVAESVVVGVSAAYWMVVGFWDMIVPNLFAKLAPTMARASLMPGVSEEATTEWIYLVPLVLGIMLLWRLMPAGGWISRWPMAFIIGVFCGVRLITFLHADFLAQIRNSIVPLYDMNLMGEFTVEGSIKNILLIIGVLTCLVYFFFSIEHRGVVGGAARVGIWYLMITFGAAFGFTVMGRIALLAIRLEFLFDDWMWLIDPGGRRYAPEVIEAATAMVMTGLPGVF